MSNLKYTGVLVVENFAHFEKLFSEKKVPLAELGIEGLYPNSYLILKSDAQETTLAKVTPDGYVVQVKSNKTYLGIKPKNKEQVLLFDLLANKDISVVSVTGRAGTGKSFLIGAYLAEQLTTKKIKKLVISKPMEIVGASKYFGTVPGGVEEKFEPFLLNFRYLFEKLAGENGKGYFDMFVRKGQIEFMPLELMRGVSFAEDTIVYLDEAQNVDNHVINTLGTRIGENCRLIISGDLNQVDVRTKDFTSGITKLINNNHFKESAITGHIHLMKVERGPVAELFAKIFDAE
jgi:PhoH-like ATPase